MEPQILEQRLDTALAFEKWIRLVVQDEMKLKTGSTTSSVPIPGPAKKPPLLPFVSHLCSGGLYLLTVTTGDGSKSTWYTAGEWEALQNYFLTQPLIQPRPTLSGVNLAGGHGPASRESGYDGKSKQ